MIYSVRNILRLCRIHCVLQNKRLNHVRVTNKSVDSKENAGKNNDFESLLQKYHDKITFNSYLEREKLQLGYFKYHLKTLKRAKAEQSRDYKERSLPPLPTALQYYVDESKLLDTEKVENKEDVKEEVFQLPFAKTTEIKVTNKNDDHDGQPNTLSTQSRDASDESEFHQADIDKWMTSYEHYDDSQLEEMEGEWVKRYGTPDPSVGITRVQCGGCGALLHCSEPAIPGYLPSEILRGRTEEELKTVECQRCHFLREYNIALDVTVEPEEYEKLLQSIR